MEEGDHEMDNLNQPDEKIEEQNQIQDQPAPEEAPEQAASEWLMSFPVDISREEFVRFNMIVSTVNGLLKIRKGQLVLNVVLGAISLMMLLSEIYVYRKVDPVLVLLLIFIFGAGCMLMFGAKAHVRRSAERSYDRSRMDGQSYYGLIKVYPFRIEKQSSRASVSMNLSNETVYIESHDMMVLLSKQTPAIVIPARCITQQDAELFRKVIFSAVPPTRQKINARLIPTATQHITPSETEADQTAWEEEAAIRIEVDYTKEEIVKMASDTALRSYMKILPYYSIMSMIAALMFGLLYNLGIGIAIYILINGGLFGFQFFGSRMRAGKLYDHFPQSRISVAFTDFGIQIRTPGNTNGIRLEWKAVTRAVERPNDVEFFSQTVFLRIPKRCVSDFNALKEFINSRIN